MAIGNVWSRPRMVPVTITCTFTEWPSAWALAVFLLLPLKGYAFLERDLRLDGGILGRRFWRRGCLGRRRGGGGLNRLVGCRICLRSAADAGGDGFLGGGVLLAGTLRRGLDAIRGLEGFDLLGQVGCTRPFLFVRLMAAGRKSGLELVAQARQFGQVGFKREGFAETCLVVA